MGKRLVILLVLIGLPVVSFAGDVEDKEAANSAEETKSPKVEYRDRTSIDLGIGAITTTETPDCLDDGWFSDCPSDIDGFGTGLGLGLRGNIILSAKMFQFMVTGHAGYIHHLESSRYPERGSHEQFFMLIGVRFQWEIPKGYSERRFSERRGGWLREEDTDMGLRRGYPLALRCFIGFEGGIFFYSGNDYESVDVRHLYFGGGIGNFDLTLGLYNTGGGILFGQTALMANLTYTVLSLP
ncbi:MAG: hypothetical protein CMH54_05075 [Myxococcales bacterium]|nr:hypothetical protein [Myxococcales bacterium]|tara:strand:+ start:155 stop:874 length:720 start_codon:yes stop_codon:yes gene_type:complete